MAAVRDETAAHPTQLLPPETWDGHVLLRHQDPSRRRASSAWVERGLQLGEKIVHVRGGTGDAAPAPTSLPETGDLVDLGEVPDEVLCGSSALHRDELLDARSRARDEGWAGVRVLAVGPLTPSRDTSLALEDEVQQACSSGGVSVLCEQLVDDWGQVHAGAEHTPAHRSIVHDRAWLKQEAQRLVVVGEVDLSNAASLGEAVARSCETAAPDGQVTIDCTEWRFADLTAARTVLRTSSAFRARGGQVHLVGLRSALARVLDVASRGSTTGVHVAAPEAGGP